MRVDPSGEACGATVSGIDLSGHLEPRLVAQIRAAWLEHRVLAFRDQSMDDDALERFTIAMGGFGEDPFFAPIHGRAHIAAIRREAAETTPLFAENWHSDWSFLSRPPAATCLLAIDIPPNGGDTLFADQHIAWEALPEPRKRDLDGLTAVHSARYAYAPQGTYGEKDQGRSMDIRPSDAAMATQCHPLIATHPETGRRGFFSTFGYIIGIEGMPETEALSLLRELYEWQTRDEFVHRLRWEPGMLVIWDNRAVLHRATGGYEGHRRELHRTTIAAPA
ncbi:TauD/TfdA dioxygenase family protein [Tsuneonella sp. HG249]